MPDQALANTREIQRGIVIDCLHSVLREIRGISVESDVSGILLGTKDDKRVRILAFRRMVPKRALGRAGALSEADRESIARLLWAPPADNELYGLEPVGWFRAQPRRDLDLSEWELELLNTFFTDGRQVGMIVRSANFGPTRARFYVREADGFVPHVFRDVNVPAMTSAVMLTVEPEARQPERPGPQPHPSDAERHEVDDREQRPQARPRQLLERPRESQRRGPLPRDIERLLEPDATGEFEVRRGRSPVWGWVWRTVSSLAIAAFVLGYWWYVSLRQQTDHVIPPRQQDLAASIDRPAVAPLPPEALPQLDETPPSPDTPSASELADLTRDLPRKDLPSKDEITPPSEPATPQPTGERFATADRRSADPPPPARALRPLRVIPLPPKKGAAPVLAAPPQFAREVASVSFLPLPQSITVTPPKPAPKSTAPPTPASGTLIWTGRLRKNATLILDGKSASEGTLTGELPGKPVQYSVYPGDLGDYGIVVFTARQQDVRQGWDSPGPQNGWNRIMYEYNPHHANGVEIEEAPGPNNSWKRLVLRSLTPRLSVLYVKWSLAR
jgi:hypothetical protein